MLLLEPSLLYALGGNFPLAVRSEGAAALELFHVWPAGEVVQTQWASYSTAGLQVTERLLALKCRNYTSVLVFHSWDFPDGGSVTLQQLNTLKECKNFGITNGVRAAGHRTTGGWDRGLCVSIAGLCRGCRRGVTWATEVIKLTTN